MREKYCVNSDGNKYHFYVAAFILLLFFQHSQFDIEFYLLHISLIPHAYLYINNFFYFTVIAFITH